MKNSSTFFHYLQSLDFPFGVAGGEAQPAGMQMSGMRGSEHNLEGDH